MSVMVFITPSLYRRAAHKTIHKRRRSLKVMSIHDFQLRIGAAKASPMQLSHQRNPLEFLFACRKKRGRKEKYERSKLRLLYEK